MSDTTQNILHQIMIFKSLLSKQFVKLEYCRDNNKIWKFLQWFTKYLRQISISVFLEIFSSTDKIFFSGGGLSTRQLFYEVLRFSLYVFFFLICTNFLRSYILRCLAFVHTSLLLIIMLRFTCGERRIFLTIENSQNIMNMIVEQL